MTKRKRRFIKKKIKIFVEGSTELNYLNGLKHEPNICLSIVPINMRGGGYSNFINKLRKNDPLGNLAIFIVIDLDTAYTDKENLEKLIKYCKEESKKELSIPHILVGTNKNFEYFACSHCPKFKDTDTNAYIINEFKYKDINEYKSDDKIYKKLNSNNRSYKNAINHNKQKDKYFNYNYEIKKKGLDIIIKPKNKFLEINEEALTNKHSNMKDLFDILFD